MLIFVSCSSLVVSVTPATFQAAHQDTFEKSYRSIWYGLLNGVGQMTLNGVKALPAAANT